MADRGGEKKNKDRTSAKMFGLSPEEVKIFVKNYRTPIASATASLVSTAVAFPLDLAKSRMQSFDTRFVPTLHEVWRTEGLRGFWRGIGPPMASVTAVRTMSFTIYQQSKYFYSDKIERFTGESPLDIANAANRMPTVWTMLCFASAGATAGSIVTVVACPFELTKLHAQLAGKMARDAQPLNKPFAALDVKSGAWRTARRLFRERGFQGLYCGFKLHLLRDTIGTSIYFMTYESAKQIIGNGRGNSPTSPLAVMTAGGMCGVVSWACTYPIDVAKTVYQKALLASEGRHVPIPPIRFFNIGSYRGLGVSILRSAVINMLFFSGFELIKKRINALEV